MIRSFQIRYGGYTKETELPFVRRAALNESIKTVLEGITKPDWMETRPGVLHGFAEFHEHNYWWPYGDRFVTIMGRTNVYLSGDEYYAELVGFARIFEERMNDMQLTEDDSPLLSPELGCRAIRTW